MPVVTAIKKRIPTKWRKLIRTIPGYDPITTAGDCYFDTEAVQLALDFFPDCLCHTKGVKAGQPFKLEKWQQAIIANLFGWKRPDGTRRYRTAFIEVARKNGKTTLAGGIVLYGLLCDKEPGAEIYSAAADRDQAKLVFVSVRGMVMTSTELTKRTRIYQNSIVAINPDTGIETGSFYKPLSAEANTKYGYNSHIVVVDELHAQRNRELVDVLETSMGARVQPLMIHITTSDYDRPSICNEIYDYACKVRDGIIQDETFLPVIYEANPDDYWTKIGTWRKANPNLGVSVSVDYIKRKCKKAQESPAFENTFKRLHLNIKTEQDVRWIVMEKWDACDKPVVEKELLGKRCYAGMDLSSNTDVTANVFVFPPDGVCKLYRVLCRFYIPEENAHKREERDRVPYITWAKQGYIKLTPGNVVNYDIVKADFEADCKKFNVQEIAFDRWNFEALRQQFIYEGINQDKFVSFGQGYISMSGPSKELEKLILAGKLAHGGNPVLRWMASNVSAEIDSAGNIKPSKKKSNERIDGIVGLIMALGRAIVSGGEKKSVYEERDMRSL